MARLASTSLCESLPEISRRRLQNCVSGPSTGFWTPKRMWASWLWEGNIPFQVATCHRQLNCQIFLPPLSSMLQFPMFLDLNYYLRMPFRNRIVFSIVLLWEKHALTNCFVMLWYALVCFGTLYWMLSFALDALGWFYIYAWLWVSCKNNKRWCVLSV